MYYVLPHSSPIQVLVPTTGKQHRIFISCGAATYTKLPWTRKFGWKSNGTVILKKICSQIVDNFQSRLCTVPCFPMRLLMLISPFLRMCPIQLHVLLASSAMISAWFFQWCINHSLIYILWGRSIFLVAFYFDIFMVIEKLRWTL